jgi:hypothetical protein
MKQGGAFLAIILAISGILGVAGPGGRVLGKPQATSGKSDATASKPTAAANRYQDALDSAIERFCKPFGDPSDTSSGNPFTGCEDSQFLIAIMPDPVHTHLALYFDRGIEALQQAAQRCGYLFDSAVLPWERTPVPDSSDSDKRRVTLEERKLTENKPGLLIFRKAPQEPSAGSSDGCDVKATEHPCKALFVLVVGETPTTGINREQFRSALFAMNSPSWGQSDAFRRSPLLILGPTFSGSLQSLSSELQAAARKFNRLRAYVYSGSVTGADSIGQFKDDLGRAHAQLEGHFASFQENDSFILDRFIHFVRTQHYQLSDIAILSEEDTAYGEEGKPTKSNRKRAPREEATSGEDLTILHFPREISFFRSEYQKESVGQSATDTRTPGQTTLPLDLSETGMDDVKIYAGVQTAESQEAVMLGIITELQKHHIEFTFLIATDPLDELFLARYIRTYFPQGRVVVSTPDLLFAREQDPLLRGVLGVSSYALVPGLNDQLCQQPQTESSHEDRLFVSTSSIGTFNAMVGLLSLPLVKPRDGVPAFEINLVDEAVPAAPYEAYSSPIPNRALSDATCESKPYVWLSVLGRDGFWPVASFRPSENGSRQSTLRDAATSPIEWNPTADKLVNASPAAWKIAYCICFLIMILHGVFTCVGSTLSPLEASAQFASARDERDLSVLALGALALSTALLVLLCARSPLERWKGTWFLTLLLWLPFFIFVIVMFRAIGTTREQRTVASRFAAAVLFICVFLSLLSGGAFVGVHMYWPSRLVNLDSGVSPVLPVLLLLAAGYWWSWQSLRGIALVDQRRPRVPSCSDLAANKSRFDAYHISDTEGDELRDAAHPFTFQWQILVPVFVLLAFMLTVVDPWHPIQTVEGFFYDWSYSLLLFLMVSTFLGCLLKLVRTWTECRQILGGLDRIPLRYAFSRMKRLSWHSMWNPGGSTLRETYKLMSRGMEDAVRLEILLKPADAPPEPIDDTDVPPLSGDVRLAYFELRDTRRKSTQLYRKYMEIVKGSANRTKNVCPDSGGPKESWRQRRTRERKIMPELQSGIEELQKRMARSAAALLTAPLKGFWSEDFSPSVSDPSVICGAKDDKADTENNVESLDARKGAHGKSGDKKASDEEAGKEKVADEKSDEDADNYKCLPLRRVLAEEYVALVYVNFLVSVLLRLRTMVMCAAGMYVFIVLSINTYPFEPHLALQSMAVLMLIAMGVAVGTVYAQMHRDNVLSRLTSSRPGELGWDFWLKLASAGAIPVFSLLASQFPSIRQFLFSWLEPALQAVK